MPLPGMWGHMPFVNYIAPGGGGSWTITVPSGAVSSNVTSFPVYLNLADMPAGFWSAVNSDGGNIRVKQSGSVIPFDVVTIDTGSDTGRLFFKADLNSGSDNVFTLDLTGSGLLDPTDTNGRNNVWTRFDRVVDGATNADRTGSGNTVSLVGNAAFSGGKIVFDGSGDFASISCGSAGNLTVFVVGFLRTGGSSSHKAIASHCGGTVSTPATRLSLLIRDTNNWSIWNSTNSWLESGTAASFDANFTAAMVHDNGVGREVWQNGVQRATEAASAPTPSTTTPYISMGGEDSSPAQEAKMDVDMVALALEALPSAYLAALHNSRRNTGSFYAIT